MFGQVSFLLLALLVLAGVAARSWALAAIGGMGLAAATVSWLWGRLALERLTYHRALSRNRALLGEEITLTLTVTNQKYLPLSWVQVEDSVPEELEATEGALESTDVPGLRRISRAVSLGGYERVRWAYRLRCTRRGYFRLGPARLRSGDLFGLFPRTKECPEQAHLLVYPRATPLPVLGLPALHPLGEARGSNPWYPDLARPAGVRDYQSGDPLKNVDWKATARQGRLQVKVLEPGAGYSLAIVVNVDTVGVPWGGQIPHYVERVVGAAASLAQLGLDQGFSVGLYTNGKSVLYERPMKVPPGRHPQQMALVLEALAMVGPYVARPIEEVLLEEERRLPQGATIVLLTAASTQGLGRGLDLLVGRRRAPLLLWAADEPPRHLAEGVVLVDLGPHFRTLEGDSGKES
ncbi:MAG: DUF58 domain-containing protein [Chloroflexi bacterium]|nr:DUF58 domain-containing protein [Chloroflexota bacterium]